MFVTRTGDQNALVEGLAKPRAARAACYRRASAPPAPPTPMIDAFFLAKSFVTLLMITNPVGTVPIFLAITAE